MKMIKLKWIFITLIGLFALNACSSSDLIFEEKKDFQDHAWMRFEVDTFNVDIKNIDDCYNIFLQCKVSKDISVDMIPIIVKMKTEMGESRSFLYDIPINKDGNIQGDKVGEIYEIDVKIRSHLFFNEATKYLITIQQVSSHFQIDGVLGIELRIEKAKLD